MGCSPWHGPKAMKPTSCGTMGQPSPLPLMTGSSGSDAVVLEAPCDLSTLTQRYVDWGSSFIRNASKPWLLYASFRYAAVRTLSPLPATPTRQSA